MDLRKWAAEGLAYLTLDADVKEDLCEDMQALRALMELAQVWRVLYFNGVPMAQGKQGKLPPKKIPVRETTWNFEILSKHRENTENFVRTQGKHREFSQNTGKTQEFFLLKW